MPKLPSSATNLSPGAWRLAGDPNRRAGDENYALEGVGWREGAQTTFKVGLGLHSVGSHIISLNSTALKTACWGFLSLGWAGGVAAWLRGLRAAHETLPLPFLTHCRRAARAFPFLRPLSMSDFFIPAALLHWRVWNSSGTSVAAASGIVTSIFGSVEAALLHKSCYLKFQYMLQASLRIEKLTIFFCKQPSHTCTFACRERERGREEETSSFWSQTSQNLCSQEALWQQKAGMGLLEATATVLWGSGGNGNSSGRAFVSLKTFWDLGELSLTLWSCSTSEDHLAARHQSSLGSSSTLAWRDRLRILGRVARTTAPEEQILCGVFFSLLNSTRVSVRPGMSVTAHNFEATLFTTQRSPQRAPLLCLPPSRSHLWGTGGIVTIKAWAWRAALLGRTSFWAKHSASNRGAFSWQSWWVRVGSGGRCGTGMGAGAELEQDMHERGQHACPYKYSLHGTTTHGLKECWWGMGWGWRLAVQQRKINRGAPESALPYTQQCVSLDSDIIVPGRDTSALCEKESRKMCCLRYEYYQAVGRTVHFTSGGFLCCADRQGRMTEMISDDK